MKQVYVKYQNAIYANYKVIVQKYVPAIRLVRGETDLSLLDTFALITVNGYVHSTAYDGVNFWILDGSKSIISAKANHVGILSFFDYPTPLLKTQLTVNMLGYLTVNSYYNGGIVISLPAPVQSIMLILGGYIQREEVNVLTKISSTQFILQLNNTSYIKRLIELSMYRDIFSELGISLNSALPLGFDINDATTDIVVSKFMTLSNSFVVSVPANNLTSEIAVLDKMIDPGRFTTKIEDRWPLINGNGKILEYYKRFDEGKWTNVVVDNFYQNAILPPLTKSQLVDYNKLRLTDKLLYAENSYFLKLSSNI